MTVLSFLRSAQPAIRNAWVVTISTIKSGAFQQNAVKGAAQAQAQPMRMITTGAPKFGGGHDRTMVILPSKWQWQKYKDSLHFYIMVGALPLLSIVFYCNVFIGPATLSEIPCGYTPKHWEYHRHPITRWLSQYVTICPQEGYERNMHYIKEMDEDRRLRRLEKKIRNLMKERGDYPNHYSSSPVVSKYIRARVHEREYIESTRGTE